MGWGFFPLAKKYVTQWGLSEEMGPINYVSSQGAYFQPNTRDCSQTVSEKIDNEIKKLIDECYKKAYDLIDSHRNEMETITQLLVEKEILTVEEICDAVHIKKPASLSDAPVTPDEKKSV